MYCHCVCQRIDRCQAEQRVIWVGALRGSCGSISLGVGWRARQAVGAVGSVQVGDGDASDPTLGSPVGGEGADLREVSSVHGPGLGARMLLLAPGS